jgi:uncharacterized protein YbbC (DUF1343 family)/CubicO group peptidase (beta-lactamase class C family)
MSHKTRNDTMLVSPVRARTLLHSLPLRILSPLTLASAITRFAALILCLIATIPVNAQETTAIQPEIHLPTEATDQLSKSIDPLIQQALTQGEMSGAVVAIIHRQAVIFEKAYGWRQLEPEKLPMSLDAVFDLASLTKPIATASCIMKLVENKIIALDDPVSKHIPEFSANGKEAITIRQLLLHTSGLTPDNSINDYVGTRSEMLDKIWNIKLSYEPNSDFRYSDVGFIVLGELIERTSGLNVHQYSQQYIFQPLQMTDTTYLPSPTLRQRAVATEKRDGQWIVGEVHDPRAFALGGIAGHAGLFSTAKDLSIFAKTLLQNGETQGSKILTAPTLQEMTNAYPVPRDGLRGLGWDKRSGYSSNRGETMTRSAYGHGGFTGTAIWIDPELQLAVIFLSSRLHPDGKGTINPLAGVIGATAANFARAANQNTDSTSPPHEVLCGIDVLERDHFKALQGANVGLITNQTGQSRNGISTPLLLKQANGVNLKAIFSPEHGLQGKLDQSNIGDGKDEATGLPIYSLYGANRAPTDEALEGIDTLVFDIQDIGTRFYTYISTMGNAMEVASRKGLRFVVLDRPNPINGIDISGPLLDDNIRSFVAYHNIPLRHGMTAGELAKMLAAENNWKLKLDIVEVRGWSRDMYLDDTDLFWIRPSPNMRTLNQALLYPGIGVIEFTNVSVGRGTDTPFERVGAPWIDARKVVNRLETYSLQGVRFLPERFTPNSSKFEGEECQGFQILVTDRSAINPVRIGLAIAHALHREYPDQWQHTQLIKLLGSQSVIDTLLAESDIAKVFAVSESTTDAFRLRRKAFLLYR